MNYVKTPSDSCLSVMLKDHIFCDLYEKLNFEMNHVSLTGLLLGSDIDPLYASYTPMELMTKYKIQLMFSNGEIDEETFNTLNSKFREYLKNISSKANCENDVIHELGKNFSKKVFLEKYTEKMTEITKKINESEKELSKHELPIKFDLFELMDKYNGVTTSNTCHGNDTLAKTYDLVKRKFYHLLYETEIARPIDSIANPTKYKSYGEYSGFTYIEYLTLCKIRYMRLSGEIQINEEDILNKMFIKLRDTNIKIRYCKNEKDLPDLVVQQKECESELKRYKLPLEFDLDGIIDSYGKKEVNCIQKVK